MRKGIVITLISVISLVILTLLGVTERIFMVVIGVAFGIFMYYLFEVFIAKKSHQQAKGNAVGMANKIINKTSSIAKSGIKHASSMYDNIISDSEEDNEEYSEDHTMDSSGKLRDSNIERNVESKRVKNEEDKTEQSMNRIVNKEKEEIDDSDELLTFVEWEKERDKVVKLYENHIAVPRKKIKLKRYKNTMDQEEPSTNKETYIEVANDPEDNTIKVYGKGLLIEIHEGKLRIYTDGEQDINNIETSMLTLNIGNVKKEIEAVGMCELEIDNQQEELVTLESEEIEFETITEDMIKGADSIAWI